MKYEVVFESERIQYVKICKELVNDYLTMINDLDGVQKYISHNEKTYTYDGEIEWIEDNLSNHNIIFSMIDKGTGEFIGNIGLNEINNNVGELGISITRSMQDKHYGTEAITALIDYTRDTLGLDGLELNVYDFNPRGIHCYEKVGFVKDGVGKTLEDIHMTLEFEKHKVKAKVE